MADGDGDDPGQPAVLENMLLAVASWWVGKHNRAEVLDLLTRNFLPVDMYEAHRELAGVCKELSPGTHKNSQSRTAGEAYAIDLYNNLLQLSNEKKLPRLLLSSDDLGKVPLGSLSVSSERSVSARLESLEGCVSKMTSSLEKITASVVSSGLPCVPLPVAPVSRPMPGAATGEQVQGLQLPPVHVPLPNVVVTAATVQQNPQVSNWANVVENAGGSIADALQAGRERGRHGLKAPVRDRSTSNSIKRKAPGQDTGQVAGQGTGENDDGFRPQGRPRKTAGGSSKVVLDDLGECQPCVQYYISNTPGQSTDELIKKVLEKCSAPLLEGKAILTVNKVECLTKEDDPRTRCWKVEVPFKFKSLMENDELYPEGWRHRKFYGDRKNQQQKSKHPKVEDPRLKEAEQELERERLELLQRQEDERVSAQQNQVGVEGQTQQVQEEGSDELAGISDSPGSGSMDQQ